MTRKLRVVFFQIFWAKKKTKKKVFTVERRASAKKRHGNLFSKG